MSERCEDVRADLLAYTADELTGLAAERVAVHVRRCATCAAIADDLSRALAAAKAARADEPAELAADDVARLVKRLDTVAPSRAPMWLAGAGALAAAAALVIVFVTRDASFERADAVHTAQRDAVHTAQRERADVMRTAQRERADVMHTAQSERADVMHAAPFDRVRVAHTPGVDLAYAGDGADMTITQQRGAAAFAFRGDGDATLTVITRAAQIRVVGTLFSVDVRAHETRIDVARGKVMVTTADGERALGEGERLSLDAEGHVRAEAAAGEQDVLLTDATLIAFHDTASLDTRGDARVQDANDVPDAPRVAASAADRDPPADARGPARRARSASVGEVVFAAERAASDGKPTRARRMLADALADPAYAESNDVLRFEIARLDGFALGATEKARASLEHLSTRAGPEMRVQSTLLLCELDLTRDRCAARACLERAKTKGGVLADEATRLLARWSVRALQCSQ